MKVRLSRILAALQHQGFDIGPYCSVVPSFALARSDSRDGLYQIIKVAAGGKRQEAVDACVEASVSRHLLYKGLAEGQIILDVADVKELVDEYGFWVPGRGQAIIETDEKAREWEQQLIKVGPLAAEQFAAKEGPALLERTKAAREAVKEYIKRLNLGDSVASTLSELHEEADDVILEECDRLIRWAVVVPNQEDIYQSACLCLLKFSSEVEGTGVSYFGEHPLENTQLMWRIQLLADKLLTRFDYQPTQ